MSAAARLEQLAATVVLADLADVAGLACLHTGFEELGATPGLDATAVAAANRATVRIAELILGDAPDPAAVLALLNDTIVALQQVIRDGRSAAEVTFPPGLGDLAPATAAGAGATGTASAGASSPGAAVAAVLPEAAALAGDFVTEVQEHLDGAEHALLALGAGEVDPQAMYATFGAFHSIKGGAALLGLTELSNLAHAAEAVLEPVARSSAPFPIPAREAVLGAIDGLRRLALAVVGGPPMDAGALSALTVRLHRCASPDTAAPAPAAAAGASIADPELLGDFVNESLEHLGAAENHLLEAAYGGGAEEHLNAVFRAFHTIKGVAGFLNLEEIRGLSHIGENLLDLARGGKLTIRDSVQTLVFETIDHMRVLVTACTGQGAGDTRATTADLQRRLKAAAEGQPVECRPRPAAPPVTPAAKSRTPAEPAESGTSADTGARTVKIKETIRLDAERVDHLVDAIGELVIAELMVGQAVEAAGTASQSLLRHLNQLGKITRELQAMGTALRMVSIRPLFQKMARLVHDLSQKMNKPVNLVMSGEETELDKTVVEQIGDPLVHLLRNSLDHGLEDDVAARVARGKPEAGRVELRAFQRGGSIFVEVEDDGRGLNRDAILAKAIKQGLVKEGATLSDREIYGLIMLPGFSTARQVTEISGRGVGLDVVRRNIEALRGQLDIHSEPGKGTLFSMRLPLTLAIIDGLVIRVNQERYILPTLAVVRTVKPESANVSTVLNHGEVLNDNGNLLPVFQLRELLGQGRTQERSLVMVMEASGRRFGLRVDELVGKQQIVIKTLGDMLRNVPAVAGGAIMPDGNVALILDVEGLLAITRGVASPAATRDNESRAA